MKQKYYVVNVQGIVIYFFALDDLTAVKILMLLGLDKKGSMLHEVQIDETGKFVVGSQITLKSLATGNSNRDVNNKQPVQA